MPTGKKVATVEALRDQLRRSKVAIFTDYRGLSVAEVSQLRRQLRQAGIDYRVAKNTLTRLAAQQAGCPPLGEILTGPTAIAFGYADEVLPAKLLTEYARSSKVLAVKAALLERRVLSAAEVEELAHLPSREHLLGRLLGTLQGPAAGLLGLLNAPGRSLLYALKAREEQLAPQQ